MLKIAVSNEDLDKAISAITETARSGEVATASYVYMPSSALLPLAILWVRISPRGGTGYTRGLVVSRAPAPSGGCRARAASDTHPRTGRIRTGHASTARAASAGRLGRGRRQPIRA